MRLKSYLFFFIVIILGSLFSYCDNTKPKVTPPPEPVVPNQAILLSPSDNATKQDVNVTFSWNSVNTATSYTIQVDTINGFTTSIINETVTTTQHDGILKHGKTYYWRVRASNSVGNGAWSAVWQLTTKEDTSIISPSPKAPGQVTLLSPMNNAKNQSKDITFMWKGIDTATSYTIQVDTINSFTTPIINDTVTTNQHDGTLNHDKTYYWRVRASNSVGNGAWSEGWTFTTTVLPPLPPPLPDTMPPPKAPEQVTLLSPMDNARNESKDITFMWEGIDTATSYTIQVDTINSFTTPIINETVTMTQHDGTLDHDKTYYWRVRASNSGVNGLWSEVWQLTTEEDMTIILPKEATYKITFNATWSRTTHPDGFPSNPHFSWMVAASHNSQVTIWQPNALASDGIEVMAESGGTRTLENEINNQNAKQVVTGRVFSSPGSDNVTLTFGGTDTLATVVSMLAPSPDWFIGVHGLSLYRNNAWVDADTVNLYVYDAGTDSGPVYDSPNDDTQPPENIKRIETTPFKVGGVLKPVGTLVFKKQ